MGGRRTIKPAAIILLLVFCFGCAGDLSLTRNGKQLLRTHDQSGAEQTFRKGIRRYGTDSRSTLEQAALCLATGRNGEARLLLNAFAATADRPARWWELSATVALHDKNFHRAAYLINRGMSRYPASPRLQKLRNRWQLEMLTDRLLRKVRNWPANNTLLKTAAFALLHNNHRNLAFKLFQKILKQNPANDGLLEKLARYHLKHNNRQQSVYYLKKLLAADRRNKLALEKLAALALRQGYIWKAYRLFYDNAKYHPENGHAWEQLGYITLRLGKKQKAAEYLKRALDKGVRNYRIYSQLGHLLLSDDQNSATARSYFDLASGYRPGQNSFKLFQKQISQKISGLKQFLSFFENRPAKQHPLHHQLARSYRTLQQYRRALPHALKAVQLLPRNPDYLYTLARLRLDLKQYARARQLIKQLKNSRYRPVAVHLLEAALYREGPFRSTANQLAALKRAWNSAPRRAGLAKRIADWYIKQQKSTTALRWYQRALTLGAPLQKTVRRLSRQLKIAALRRESAGAHSWRAHHRYSRQFAKLTGAGSAEACRHAAAAAALQPKSAPLQITAGEQYANAFFKRLRFKDLQRSIRFLQNGLRLDPDHRFAGETLAKLRIYDLSTGKKALAALTEWQKRDRLTAPLEIADQKALITVNRPRLLRKLFRIGKIMHRSHRDDKAIDYIKRSIKLAEAPSVEQLLAAAAVYRERGNYLTAARYYRKLAQIKNLPDPQQYALLKLVTANMYAAAAQSYPATLSAYSNAVSTNGSFDLQAATAAARKAQQWKNNAIRYYQLYVNANKFYTQKQMGRNKITLIRRFQPTAAHAILQAASLLRNNGMIQQAEQMLLANIDAMKDKDEKKQLYASLAAIYNTRNSYGKLDRLYRELVKLYPADWRNFNNYGNFLLSTGNLDRSIKIFEQSSTLKNNNPATKTVLGFLYWKTGDYNNSLKRLQDAIRIDEDRISALYIMMQVLLNRKNTKQAFQTGTKLVKSFKEDMLNNIAKPGMKAVYLDTLSTMAHISFAEGNRPAALNLLYEGMQFDPGDKHNLRILAGDLFYMQGDFVKAEHYYAASVKLHPGNSYHKYKLAAAMLKNSKEYQALQIFSRLTDQDERFRQKDDMLLTYAKTLLKMKRSKRGEKILHTLITSYPHRQHGYLTLAEHLLKANRPEAAKTVLEKGVKSAQPAANVRDALVWFLLDRKKEYRRAHRLAVKNTRLYPKNITYRATLSYVQFKLQQKSSRNSSDSADQALQLPAKTRRQEAVFADTGIEQARQLLSVGEYDKALVKISEPWSKIKLRNTSRNRAVSDLLFTGLTGTSRARMN